MILRILASIILLLSALFMPWWISVVLGLAGMMYFSFFLEAIFLFLLSDLLYRVPEPRFFNMVGVSFIGAIVCLIILELLKKKLRFHSKLG